MLRHLQKPGVQMGLLAVVVAGAGVAFMLTKRPGAPVNAPPDAKQGTAVTSKGGGGVGNMAVEDKKVNLGEDRTARLGSDAQVDRLVIPKDKPKPPSLTQLTTTTQKKEAKAPPFPKLVHINAPATSSFTPPAPRLFAPRGLLIKAALVITVDSSSLDTPVLALVTDDVYWAGHLIVPAGTQVQATASQGRQRDRIEVKGPYTFVWADGKEYNINCVALDHEPLSDGTFAITDGSAGIRGQIIKNDANAEVKILIAEALQGVMNNGQEKFQTIYGMAPTNTTNNAALGGGAQAASAYSQMLTKKLDKDLDFVRVAAGTQFYIYTRDVFEPELASVAGLRQGGKAASSWQLAEETFARAQAEEAGAAQQAGISAAEAKKAEEQRLTTERAEHVRALVAPSPASAGPASSTPSTSSKP